MGEDGGCVAVLCVSDADLGNPFSIRDDSGQRALFRAEWPDRLEQAIAARDAGRVGDLVCTASPVSGGPTGGRMSTLYPSVPLGRLLVPLAGSGSPSALVLLATQEFQAHARLLAEVVMDDELRPAGWAQCRVLEVPLEQIAMTAARDATSAALDGLGSGVGRVTRVAVGAGAAQLALGTLLGALESSAAVEILDVMTGEAVDHRLPAAPLRWLLRQRYFGEAATLVEADQPDLARLLRLFDERQDLSVKKRSYHGRAMPAPTVEDAFFDQVASRSVQSVFMGRSWLEERYLALGGVKLNEQGKPAKGKSPWLGTTISWFTRKNNRSKEGTAAAREMLASLAFLNDLAAGTLSTPHPARALPMAKARRLRAAEIDARTRDPRFEPSPWTALLPEAMPFPATPNGRCLVIRCVGGHEVQGDLLPMVEALDARARAGMASTILDVAPGEVAGMFDGPTPPWTWHLALVHSTATTADASAAAVAAAAGGMAADAVAISDPADIATTRAEISSALDRAGWAGGELAPDAIVFVGGQGTQHMQMGSLLAAAELAVRAGAPLFVGALRRAEPSSRSQVDLDASMVAAFPGWQETLLPLARILVQELEFANAAVVLRVLGRRFAAARAEVLALRSRLSDNLRKQPMTEAERALTAAGRLQLVRTALVGRDPVLSFFWAFAVVELSLQAHPRNCASPPDCPWCLTEVRALRWARNNSPVAHGATVRNANALASDAATHVGLTGVTGVDALFAVAIDALTHLGAGFVEGAPAVDIGGLTHAWERALVMLELGAEAAGQGGP